MDVAHHQGFMEGSPSPTSCPTSPESRGLREQVWEEGTGAHEDAIFLPTPHPYLKIAPLRPRSLPCCFILHPFQSYPRCQLIQRSRMLRGGGGGRKVSGGGNHQSRPQQIPWETAPGREGHNGLIAAHEAEHMALTQITGVWGSGGKGQVACPIQVNLQGLGLEWGELSGRGGRGGVGFPVCRPWPVSPVAPRQQQERGRGSS